MFWFCSRPSAEMALRRRQEWEQDSQRHWANANIIAGRQKLIEVLRPIEPALRSYSHWGMH